jgi:mono/diheme cytochrome c family protein
MPSRRRCSPRGRVSGKGDGPASKIFKPPPRDHTDPTYMGTITDADMEKTIQQGGGWKGKPLMPSNPQIRGADMTALVAYVRSLSKTSTGSK